MACVVMTHTKPDHEYVPMAEVTGVQKEEIGQVIPALEARTAVIGSAIGQIATTRQAVVERKLKAEADIRANFNSLHDILRDREKEAINLVAALTMEKQKILGSQAEALSTTRSSMIGCAEQIQHTLDNCTTPEILVSRPVLLQRSSALLQQECVLLPEATADLWVDTDTERVHAAIGTFCNAFVPNASSEHCTADGSGLEGTQMVGQASEFVVDLRDSQGEPARIVDEGGEAGAVMAALIQIVAVEAVVVSAAAVANEDAEAAAAGAGAGAPPPLPPSSLPSPPAMQLIPRSIGGGLQCRYTPTFEGVMRINVKVFGQDVPGSPFQVQVDDGVTFLGWATWQQDADKQRHDGQNRAMDAACAAKYPGSRAATYDEVISGSIKGVPANNSSGDWLVTKHDTREQQNPNGPSFTRRLWTKGTPLTAAPTNTGSGPSNRRAMAVR
jgi:hypothetical protein